MQTARSFLWALLVLVLAKLLLAVFVPPFGDEVFYWQEGRQLAAGYSDLPLLTAWLIRAGSSLLGNNLLGLRAAFVLCGVATVWLLLRWAEFRRVPQMGVFLLVPALPLLLLGGQLATADAPLTLAFVGAAYALDRALQEDRRRDWLLFGVAIALAWLAHWRAVMLYPVGLLLLAVSPRARQAAGRGRFWWAQGVGLLGLVPTLWFNIAHDWIGFRFQAVDRHRWQFDPISLLQPLEQAASVGIVLYPLLLWAMWRAWRRRSEPGFDVIAAMSIAIAGGYFAIGLFADSERTRFHWPLPAYLPLLLVLADVALKPAAGLGRWLRWGRWCGYVTSALLVAMLISLGHAGEHWPPGGDRRMGEPFLGWDVAAQRTRSRLEGMPAETVVVADNFLLAAQLDFAWQGTRPVYVLDHPRNRKHGRQPQLAIWQRDAQSLHASGATRMLLVVEENALYGADTLPFYRQLCRDFLSVRRVQEEALFGTAKRFVWFELATVGQQECQLPPLALLHSPEQDQQLQLGLGFELSGWAVREPDGIEALEVRIDGRVDESASAAYGVSSPYIHDVWPDLVDAHWPNVGFYQANVGRDLPAGTHRVEVRVKADGIWRRVAVRRVHVK